MSWSRCTRPLAPGVASQAMFAIFRTSATTELDVFGRPFENLREIETQVRRREEVHEIENRLRQIQAALDRGIEMGLLYSEVMQLGRRALREELARLKALPE
jgi:hypothetical protein